MGNQLRTALEGGGCIRICISTNWSGDVSLEVIEEWARLTAPVMRGIPAAELDAAEDPDAVIRSELERMVQRAHMNHKVRNHAE